MENDWQSLRINSRYRQDEAPLELCERHKQLRQENERLVRESRRLINESQELIDRIAKSLPPDRLH